MTNRDMTDTASTLPVHLAKGGNIALTTLDAELGSVTVVLETAGREGRAVDADVSVLLLGDDRRVRSNDDLIFYNHPVALAGAVHLRDKIRTDDDDAPVSTDVVTLELDDVPDDVERIVLSASLDPSLAVEFGTASAVNMRIRRSSDAAELLLFAVADLSSETALLLASSTAGTTSGRCAPSVRATTAGLRSSSPSSGSKSISRMTPETSPLQIL